MPLLSTRMRPSGEFATATLAPAECWEALAGADASAAFRLPRWSRWRALYLPAALPALITGWVTAAGGAWNGSIVAEYIEAGGRLRITRGLGSLISEATAHANFPLLAGGIALMSLVVVSWNRLVWRSMMGWAQARFGLEQ